MEKSLIIQKMLTQHFSLAELSRDLNPPKHILENLRYVAQNILEPLREKWGGPVIINSGYRTEEHNRRVGGSPTSLHTRGLAVDIKCSTFAMLMHYMAIIVSLNLDGKLSFNELYPSFKSSTGTWWLHVSTYKQPYLNELKIRFDMNGKFYK